jgi:hypothetical protein
VSDEAEGSETQWVLLPPGDDIFAGRLSWHSAEDAWTAWAYFADDTLKLFKVAVEEVRNSDKLGV